MATPNYNIYKKGEVHYNFAKLIKAGMSLRDTTTLFRVAAVAAEKGMMSDKDRKDLEDIRQRMDALTNFRATKQEAQAQAILRFKPNMQLPHQNETIAEWIAGATGLAPYGDRWMQRYGALVARSKPYKRAKPKRGSFKEVAGKTRVINADKVAKELKELGDTIARFIIQHGKDKKAANKVSSMLGSALKSVTTKSSYDA